MKYELLITFWIVGIVFAVAGVMFESKKSWIEGHYTGPRNGAVLVIAFLAFGAWFMAGIVIPNPGQQGNFTFTQFKVALPSLVIGVAIFFITILIKKKYLSKKKLL